MRSASVLETVDRRGDAAPAGDHVLARETRHRHHRRMAEQPAELDGVADLLARDGDDPHCGRLLVDHAYRRLGRDYAGDRGRRRVAGDRDHVESDGADARHRLKLLYRERTRVHGVDHALVLRDRDERARKSADVGARHYAALLHLVVQEGERGGRAGRARLLEADLLQDVSDGVTDG